MSKISAMECIAGAPLRSGSMPAGGLAVFRIQLLPMWRPSSTAVLQVNCALGKVPEGRKTEGAFTSPSWAREGSLDQLGPI
jgi:hypothetical protein